MLAFIFPGTDHGGRPNTLAAECLVRNVNNINILMQSIQANNNLAAIADNENNNLRLEKLNEVR